MLDRFKNLKIVKKLNETVSPKLRWLKFSKSGIDKSSPEYIKMISGVEDLQTNSDERRLEAMVREQLKEELKSFIENNINTDEYQKAAKKKTLVGLAGSFVEGAIIGFVIYKIYTLLNN